MRSLTFRRTSPPPDDLGDLTDKLEKLERQWEEDSSADCRCQVRMLKYYNSLNKYFCKCVDCGMLHEPRAIHVDLRKARLPKPNQSA